MYMWSSGVAVPVTLNFGLNRFDNNKKINELGCTFSEPMVQFTAKWYLFTGGTQLYPSRKWLLWRVRKMVHFGLLQLCKVHRNLSTRTSKFVPVQQTFRAKKNLVKSLLFSTLDNVIYYNGTIFLQSTKPLFTSQNRVETSWKKFAHFFQHAHSRSRFLW
jgi:hypothetical protein